MNKKNFLLLSVAVAAVVVAEAVLLGSEGIADTKKISVPEAARESIYR